LKVYPRIGTRTEQIQHQTLIQQQLKDKNQTS